MIEVQNLCKQYGPIKAVQDISFNINEGEIVGFLGPNGAGKSTTMNILTGYLSASSGKVTVGGVDILEDPMGVKKQIGYLPEQPPLYLDMTVKEYLNFIYNLKGLKLSRKAHIDEVCHLVRIDHVYNRLIGNLSKGYKQRVGVAQALLGNPKVLILDEPTVGLDPKQIIEIRNLIKHLGRNHTIILSSHILSEVQAVCERLIVINQGQIVADGTPTELSNSLRTDHKLVARIAGPQENVYQALISMSQITDVSTVGEKEPGVFEFTIESKQGSDVRRDLFEMASKNNWPLMGLRNNELTLEDVFLQLISKGGDSQ
ncbi:ABC transporter ATP-binding protein [Solibaculum mannosilyticum]|uniref:ABC transporter ATP-binding protein n=1 Tax=Solibaculum mannosilyticum TaxID=2780922 RepID=A0A7I8D438_9FIRM|nr:ATP-binding cassette domain-containing protein [Solibaculum mannosilyticum]BCI59414.1 ABC transporter ATP-binding protein [Solibaculum mannosilyticum]